MKIQLDTIKKTIKLDEDVKFSTLIETLNKILPKGEWKKFTLETNTVFQGWTNPIIIKEYPTYPQYPTYPWWGGTYCSSQGKSLSMQSSQKIADYSLKEGTYNIEI